MRIFSNSSAAAVLFLALAFHIGVFNAQAAGAETQTAAAVSKSVSYNAKTALPIAVAALKTVDEMLRFAPGVGDRILGVRGGVPLYREWAGSNIKPATAWPLSQLLSARIDIAAFYKNMSTVDLLIDELDDYIMSNAYAPDHKSRRFGGSKRLWDDNAWLGLGFLQAYKQTKNSKYLDKAKSIVAFMESGIQKTGGILWEEKAESPSFNTCANAPSAQFFLGLYEATREKRYLDDAKNIEKVLNGLLRRKDCLYSDNVRAADRSKRDETIWSYNQGSAIGANIQFYLMLPSPAEKKHYWNLARQSADAMLKKIASEPEWLWKQPPAFNCIFFRNLMKLDAISPDARIRETLDKYLERAYTKARRAANGAYELDGVGVYGSKDTTGITLIDQSAFAQMFALAAMSRDQILKLF